MVNVRVFVSYSHRDEKWKDRLMAHLGLLERTGQVNVWDDRKMQAGDQWRQQIKNEITQADIVVMLISADFLASSVIQNIEVPLHLERQQKEGTVILPVIVRPCVWHTVDWLARLQVLPRDGRPLSQQKDSDEVFLEVAQRIVEIGEIVSAQKTSTDRQVSEAKVVVPTPAESATGGPRKTAKQVFICHHGGDGDFAELLKLKLEKAGFHAWIDVDRLRVGDDWRAEIDDAIRASTALVVIMTPEAKGSEYVTYEWSYAAGAKIKVIPLMVKPTQLHPRLESLQYLDFSNRRARPWERLIEELTIQSGDPGRIETDRD